MDRKIKAGKNVAYQKLVDKEKPRFIEVKRKELLGHHYLEFHGKDMLTPFVYNSFSDKFWKEPQDNIKCIDFIISEKLQDALPTEKSEHEFTREHISEKIDKLSSDLANKGDLIRIKVEIINKIKSESIQTQKVLKDEIFGLKESLLRYLPHKITFRISIYFVSLFLFAFFADMLGVQIIKPFWNILGMSVSGGFMIMAYFLFLDWQKCNVNGPG